jgi:hypothetical protein
MLTPHSVPAPWISAFSLFGGVLHFDAAFLHTTDVAWGSYPTLQTVPLAILSRKLGFLAAFIPHECGLSTLIGEEERSETRLRWVVT